MDRKNKKKAKTEPVESQAEVLVEDRPRDLNETSRILPALVSLCGDQVTLGSQGRLNPSVKWIGSDKQLRENGMTLKDILETHEYLRVAKKIRSAAEKKST